MALSEVFTWLVRLREGTLLWLTVRLMMNLCLLFINLLFGLCFINTPIALFFYYILWFIIILDTNLVHQDIFIVRHTCLSIQVLSHHTLVCQNRLKLVCIIRYINSGLSIIKYLVRSLQVFD